MNRLPDHDGGADAQWILHLYRSFVQTATMWRQRMDVTANWAVPLLIGLATFALGDAALPHLLFLLLGSILIGSAVIVEARRYRELHHSVWRTYLVEVGWFARHLSNLEVDPSWRSALASDLYQPRPRVRMASAVLARMRRTYLVLFYLLVVAWVCKVIVHPEGATSVNEVLGRMSLGFLPGGWFAGAVFALLAAATVLTLASPSLADLENWASDLALRKSENAPHRAATPEDRRGPAS